MREAEREKLVPLSKTPAWQAIQQLRSGTWTFYIMRGLLWNLLKFAKLNWNLPRQPYCTGEKLHFYWNITIQCATILFLEVMSSHPNTMNTSSSEASSLSSSSSGGKIISEENATPSNGVVSPTTLPPFSLPPYFSTQKENSNVNNANFQGKLNHSGIKCWLLGHFRFMIKLLLDNRILVYVYHNMYC